MARPALVARLKASLNDAAEPFTAEDDADFHRHLDIALAAMATKRRRVQQGHFTCVADTPLYDAVPVDLVALSSPLWGSTRTAPVWAGDHPAPLPRLSVEHSADGGRLFRLLPAPTAAQIRAVGTDRYDYLYLAAHESTDDGSTLAPADGPLLILRAQAEACRELAFRGVAKPVSLREGQASTPRNMTPRALYEALLDEWRAAA